MSLHATPTGSRVCTSAGAGSHRTTTGPGRPTGTRTPANLTRMGDPSAADPLFSRMVAEGRTLFLLAALDARLDVTDAEDPLVTAALNAGVLGALAIMREEDGTATG